MFSSMARCMSFATVAGGIGFGIGYTLESLQKKDAATVNASSELLVQAVKANQISVVANTLKSFKTPEEKRAAFQHRSCHYGTPLGEAVGRGNVEITQLLLTHLSDADAAAGNQCSTIAVGFGQVGQDYSNINAAVIALDKCDTKWRKHSEYPCEEMLAVLRARGAFAILREQKVSGV